MLHTDLVDSFKAISEDTMEADSFKMLKMIFHMLVIYVFILVRNLACLKAQHTEPPLLRL